jgi:hypothetical protein
VGRLQTKFFIGLTCVCGPGWIHGYSGAGIFGRSTPNWAKVLATAVRTAALVADASPERKDVVIAVLGASAALGGFVLVFLGTVIAAYQSLPPGASKAVRDRNTQAKWPIVIAFSLSLASVALGLIWLAAPGGTDLYRATVTLFAVELAAILLLAVWTTFRTLR